MIDVDAVVAAVPHFERLPAVADLEALVASLRGDRRFDVHVAGTSHEGRPIHHVRFGAGALKVLVVAGQDTDEPIGFLTVSSLLSRLRDGEPKLVEADVEWHVVPCMHPDGAVLNEGWSQRPFTMPGYVKGHYKPEHRDGVEWTFPINYKRLAWNEPSRETQVLAALLCELRPDFYYALHNGITGGAFFFFSRDVGQPTYDRIYALLDRHSIPLKASAPHAAWCDVYAPGMLQEFTTRGFYDTLERSMTRPEQVIPAGGTSTDYLADIHPGALRFTSELPYVRHPSDGSTRETGESVRRLKLHAEAEYKLVAAAIFEEWDRVEGDLDRTSPLYTKIVNGMVSVKDQLIDGLPSWPTRTRDVVFNPAYGATATEGERFDTFAMGSCFVLAHSYEFVRLLRTSRQTPAVQGAIERLDAVFDDALAEIDREVDFGAFDVIDYDTLARVQLGSGLIALNATLESPTRRL
jgi:hypothetical protein